MVRHDDNEAQLRELPPEGSVLGLVDQGTLEHGHHAEGIHVSAPPPGRHARGIEVRLIAVGEFELKLLHLEPRREPVGSSEVEEVPGDALACEQHEHAERHRSPRVEPVHCAPRMRWTAPPARPDPRRGS
ncbi:MAG: hypothetical protein WBM40_15610 [Thiohalocapsa sp.]